ncbi:hypothetical protein ACFV0L_07140 [Streptosporangium canum]|uniref:hypothetical protein n=1 Tax=Streptosporangium canum TaxID=324952 RepID=UPI0036A79CF0
MPYHIDNAGRFRDGHGPAHAVQDAVALRKDRTQPRSGERQRARRGERAQDAQGRLPVCVGGKGDNPIEHYDPEYPEEPVPFDQDAVTKRLAARWKPTEVA